MRAAELLRALPERPRLLLAIAITLQWLTTLVVAAQADGLAWGLREGLNVLVIGPLALVCALRVATNIGGPAFGAWALLVWVTTPWLARALTLTAYDETLRENVLPLALGLTAEPGYAAGAALLAATALLTASGVRSTLLAGAAGGAAVLLVPTTVIFAVPALLGLVVARRSREVIFFLAPVLPALLAAWLWRDLSFGEGSLDQLQANMDGLREYFWSQRLLQWLPLAGAVGVARRSLPLAIVLGGWFVLFLTFHWTRAGTGFENGELFRVLLPALPAYILLAAALPLLVPTLSTRLGALNRPVEAP